MVKQERTMLKEELKSDKATYKCRNVMVDLYKHLTANQIKYFRKIVMVSRKFRYYRDQKSIVDKILRVYYQRKFNLLARKSHINIQAHFGKNLRVWHENIIVNQFVQIGDNVEFHGNNCVGNNGKDLEKCPRIGNNVDVGYGATIIGDITIADNIIIGANSLVNKSFEEEGIIIAGVPAKKIGSRK